MISPFFTYLPDNGALVQGVIRDGVVGNQQTPYARWLRKPGK